MFLLSTLSITIMLSYPFINRVENNKVFISEEFFYYQNHAKFVTIFKQMTQPEGIQSKSRCDQTA